MDSYSIYEINDSDLFQSFIVKSSKSGLIDYEYLDKLLKPIEFNYNQMDSVIKILNDLGNYFDKLIEDEFSPYDEFLASTILSCSSDGERFFPNEKIESCADICDGVIRSVFNSNRKKELIGKFDSIPWDKIRSIYSSSYGIEFNKIKEDLCEWQKILKDSKDDSLIMIVMG